MSQVIETQQIANKKVVLSFEEICPRWSMQLAGIKQEELDINSYDACIVGEAHANNGTHYISSRFA